MNSRQRLEKDLAEIHENFWSEARQKMGLNDKAFTEKLVGGVQPIRQPHHHPFLNPLSEE